MGIKNVFSFGRDLWDPSNRFETSWLLSPWLLFACRFLIGLYALVTRLVSLIYRCDHPINYGGCKDSRQSFSYFTILTFWGLAFYFLVAALHTATYALRGPNRSTLDVLPRPLQALHSLFYTTVVVYPFVVTIVFWGILYSSWFDSTLAAWENITQHAMNSGFALFEIFIPRTSMPPWIHILWLIIILALYLALAYVTYAAQGFYVYSFLDYKWAGGRGLVAAYIFGIAVGTIIIFCIVWLVIWFRKWLTESKLGMDGKFSKRGVQGRDVEMSNVHY